MLHHVFNTLLCADCMQNCDFNKTCLYMKYQVQWMMKMGLGGWMVWDLSADDFNGKFCNSGKYPLINRLNKALKGEVITMP